MKHRRLQRAVHAVHIAQLEPRIMMSASVGQCGCPACTGVAAETTNYSRDFALEATAIALQTSTAVAGATHPLSSVPVLNSLPGAPNTIYLDFNGDASLHNTPAYDLDGDTSTFSDAELASITKIWETVSEKFSPFNVNVTTVQTAGAYKALIGGAAWSGPHSGYSTGGVAYVFSGVKGQDAPVSWGTVAAHELGHSLGLSHQRVYNPDGTLLYEYNFGTDKQTPIMGIGLGPRSMWWYGQSGPTTNQDDIAVLASRLGYRADDHGNTAATATPLDAASSFTRSGIIEKGNDYDYFGFSTSGGTVSIKVDSLMNSGGMLNPSLKLMNGSGTVLATADGAGNLLASQLGETINLTLPAGTYYIAVYGHGDYGDVGQYTLTGSVTGAIQPPAPTPLPTPTPEPMPVPDPTPVAIVTAPAAPTLQSATPLSTSQIKLTWSDNANNETGYKVERSTDGVNFAQVATLGTNAVTWTDTGQTAGTQYVYRVNAYNTAGSAASAAVAASTLTVPPPATPGTLTVTAASSSRLNLRWGDVAGETGYRVERSTDGVNFTQIATTAANVITYADLGASPGTQYVYRVLAYSAAGNSGYTNTVAATTPAAIAAIPAISAILGSPADYSVSYLGGHNVKLAWTDASTAETGYEVWKSSDGIKWTLIKTLGVDSTGWTTANDNAYGKTYQWKVRAVNKYTRAVSNFTSVVSTSIPSDGLLSTWEKWLASQAA